MRAIELRQSEIDGSQTSRLDVVSNLKISLPINRVLLVIFLSGCVTPLTKPIVPAPTFTDYSSREDCLYKTTCELIKQRGSSPVTLDGIAQTATTTCSLSLHEKMLEHVASTVGYAGLNDEETDEEIDTDQTERHAFAIALQQSDSCSLHP